VLQIPTGLTRLFMHPTLDWNLQTVMGGKSMGNVGSYIARGKLLGGSSSTNATLYHRGSAADYESWGIKGWKSDDVLPWFKCAEDNPAFKGSKYHSTGMFLLLCCSVGACIDRVREPQRAKMFPSNTEVWQDGRIGCVAEHVKQNRYLNQ
jgi:choline dehydrogenase-like flavoprotein